jgi:hypothetical protein
MPTIGQDCHITLNHPDVNGGQAYGVLVNENGGTRPGGVEITHEVDTYGTTRLWLYFDILLADFAVNPDGSIHQATRSQDYTMLLQYLSQLDSIMLATPIGSQFGCSGLDSGRAPHARLLPHEMPDQQHRRLLATNRGGYLSRLYLGL